MDNMGKENISDKFNCDFICENYSFDIFIEISGWG